MKRKATDIQKDAELLLKFYTMKRNSLMRTAGRLEERGNYGEADPLRRRAGMMWEFIRDLGFVLDGIPIGAQEK